LASDVIVIDGSLQQHYSFEDVFFKKFTKKNIIGFSKTSSLLTKSGNSILALMNLHEGKFVYAPVAVLSDATYQAHVCFVRLHERSKHVFKLDFNSSIDEYSLGLLAENSTDPVFLGYPYGLILADQLARVGANESEYLKTKFSSKITDKHFLHYLNALNAHELLDTI
jgi:NurA-like 5'-3' nuclease